MSEPEITAGTRVEWTHGEHRWVRVRLGIHHNQRAWDDPVEEVPYWSYDDEWLERSLPDHPALPAVAAELARQGPEAMAVVMSREKWEWIIGLLHESGGDFGMYVSRLIRRQLDGQRGGGA